MEVLHDQCIDWEFQGMMEAAFSPFQRDMMEHRALVDSDNNPSPPPYI
jgi:hypothetical protein